MIKRIFIFAGTTEGRLLYYEALKHKLYTDVFVATDDGKKALYMDMPPLSFQDKSTIHVGRLDEEEIKERIEELSPDIIFDATHPFAREVTENIRRASEATGREYVRIKRDETRADYDRISYVSDMVNAVELLENTFAGKKVLFTTGSKDVGEIELREDYYFRILEGKENTDKLLGKGVKSGHIITGWGPFSTEDNIEAIRHTGAEVVVTKESGTSGGFDEKLRAAKECGIDVIVIRRPAEDGISLDEGIIKLKEMADK